jgi:transposase
VITLVQRRRRWSRAEKERIVAAALEPGAVASEVARAAGIHSSQLFRWRQQLCERAQTLSAFNPAAIATEPGTVALPSLNPSPEHVGTVEIEFATGGLMRISGAGRCRDGVGADQGAGAEQAATMIPSQAARGFGWQPATRTCLALIVQETLKRDPRASVCVPGPARRPDQGAVA